MRLLKRSSDGDISLTNFHEDHIPRYAILSHTWTDGQEVSYAEFVSGTGSHKTGFDKIRFCVDKAAEDGIEYSWVDTCCINKSQSDELSTAINSMFRWYQQAARCYVYLSDVQVPEEVSDARDFRLTWDNAFRKSRWFTRGWTLQELLAPATVEFFSREHKRLGSKISLEKEIHEITQIPVEALGRVRLADFSIDERMRWTSRRSTTMKEDKAYCLLGIFGVFMPLIYGEGEEHALRRLREEMAKRQTGSGVTNSQDVAVTSLLPFARNLSFTGREDQICILQRSLLYLDGHRRMALCGLGGCGKSAVALEFAYRAMATDAGRLVFWVPAINQQGFTHAYREIGQRLGVPGITANNADILKLVKEALDSDKGRTWLMIIDNADDPNVLLQRLDHGSASARLYDYLPLSDRGKVLFTTRNRKAAESLTPGSILELQDMSAGESKQLFLLRTSNKSLVFNDEAVTELLEALSYLPLAIVQAAAFINSNDVSVSEYVSMLRETETNAELFGERFEDHTRYSDMDSTVARTWYISFDQIRRQDPLAAEYLSFMACIDRVHIPESLLPRPDSRIRHTKAIGTLKGYAFITERQQIDAETNNEKFFDMHRLVHMTSEWWLVDQGEFKTWTFRAALRLDELIPYETHAESHSELEMRANYTPHALRVTQEKNALNLDLRVSLWDRVGKFQLFLGRFAEALATMVQLLKLMREVHGLEHRATLNAMHRFAIILGTSGKSEEAAVLLEQAADLKKAVLGPKDPDTILAMHDFATTMYLLGKHKYQEVEVMFRQTNMLEIDNLGPKHPYTLKTSMSLALLLGKQGKHEEAEALFKATVELQCEVIGPKHADTFTSMCNLAEVLGHRGKFEEAEALLRSVVKEQRESIGPKHPQTLAALGNLALILSHQDKHQEAEEMFRTTIELQREMIGPNHPDTLACTSDLIGMLSERGRFQDAEPWLRVLIQGQQESIGLKHPRTISGLDLLATILYHQDKYQDAEEIYSQLIELQSEVLGPKHPDVLDIMKQSALTLSSQHKYREAEEMYNRLIELQREVIGPKHPDVLDSTNELALALDSQLRYKDAEEIYNQLIELQSEVLGPNHPDVLESMGRTALALNGQCKYEEAEARLQAVIEMRKELLGPENTDTLRNIWELAEILANRERLEEAEPLFKKAVAGFTSTLGEDHPGTRACSARYTTILGEIAARKEAQVAETQAGSSSCIDEEDPGAGTDAVRVEDELHTQEPSASDTELLAQTAGLSLDE